MSDWTDTPLPGMPDDYRYSDDDVRRDDTDELLGMSKPYDTPLPGMPQVRDEHGNRLS